MRPLQGFFVAGSSIEAMNGVYKKVEKVPSAIPHTFHYACKFNHKQCCRTSIVRRSLEYVREVSCASRPQVAVRLGGSPQGLAHGAGQIPCKPTGNLTLVSQDDDENAQAI